MLAAGVGTVGRGRERLTRKEGNRERGSERVRKRKMVWEKQGEGGQREQGGREGGRESTLSALFGVGVACWVNKPRRVGSPGVSPQAGELPALLLWFNIASDETYSSIYIRKRATSVEKRATFFNMRRRAALRVLSHHCGHALSPPPFPCVCCPLRLLADTSSRATGWSTCFRP